MKKWMKVMSVAVAMLACMSAQTASPARYEGEIAAGRPSKEVNEDGSGPVCNNCGGNCGDLCKMQKDSSCCKKKRSTGGSMDQGTFTEQPKNKQPKSAARAAVEGE